MFLNKNSMFKFKINLDRHGQRTIMKICHIPDPSLFANNIDLDMLEEDGHHFLGFDESCLSQVRKVFPAPATHTINEVNHKETEGKNKHKNAELRKNLCHKLEGQIQRKYKKKGPLVREM